MQFCEFRVQIDNYRAYATIPRNEFSTNDQDLWNNHTDATISCKVIARDLRIYGGLIVALVIWSSIFFAVFVFWFMFSAIVRFFVTFGIAISFERNLRPFPIELASYYPGFSGSSLFFLSITCQRAGLLLKDEIFVINIPLVRSFTVFT